MILQPIGCRVLIRRREIRKVGSLYVLPQSQEMKSNIGEIISVGEDCEKLKVGDVVTFGKYAPMKLDSKEFEYYGIEYDQQNTDEEILLMNEEDVLCVVLKDKPEAA